MSAVSRSLFRQVYVLPPKAAEKFAKGEPPGCWVSPELLERVQQEAKAEDKGMAARLERAARMVAVLRGLGFAGAYIGGNDNAERIQWIINRSDRWGEMTEEAALSVAGRALGHSPSYHHHHPMHHHTKVFCIFFFFFFQQYTPHRLPSSCCPIKIIH